MSRETYSTKQKEIILDYLKKSNRELDANDIYQGLNKEVGLTTIYRYLDKLVYDNKLQKITEDKKVKYRYLEDCTCDNHFYLKCSQCGDLFHIDCDCLETLHKKILKNHNFDIEHRNIILSGICLACKKKEGEK